LNFVDGSEMVYHFGIRRYVTVSTARHRAALCV
jgi:hypothetical protein